MCNLTKLAGAASISCFAADRKNQDQVSVTEEMVWVLKNTIRSKIHLIKGRDHSILFRTWQVSRKIRHFRGKGEGNFLERKIGLSSQLSVSKGSREFWLISEPCYSLTWKLMKGSLRDVWHHLSETPLMRFLWKWRLN